MHKDDVRRRGIVKMIRPAAAAGNLDSAKHSSIPTVTA